MLDTDETYEASRLFAQCEEGHPDDHWQLKPLCHARTMVGPHWRKATDPPICGFTDDSWEHHANNEERHDFVPPPEGTVLVLGENAWRDNACRGREEVNEFGEVIASSTEWPAEVHMVVCYCLCHASRIYVNVYELAQGYGGPEEGGWYYEAGVPIAAYLCENLREAERLQKSLREGRFPDNRARYSVRPQNIDFGVYIETHFAAPFPEQTPRYS